MKTKNRLFVVVIVFSLILVGCAKENIEDASQLDLTTNSNQMRPFKGSIAYVGDQDPSILDCDCAPGYFIGNYFLGTGNVTHMGNVTAPSIPCIALIDDGQGNIIGYEVNTQCGYITAANGDELYSEVASYIMMLDFNCFCQFTGETTVEITGGTGRFEDAYGTANVSVVQDASTGVTTTTWDGGINY